MRTIYFVFLLLFVNVILAQPQDKGRLDAAFLVSSFDVVAGDCLNFTDQSTGGPTAWQWSFPGSETPISTVQNPTNICYYYVGTYDVVLEVQNGTSINTEVIEACINVLPNTTTPIANFKADYTTIPVGSIVNFSNISQNGPFGSYNWKFEGGLPATSTAGTPVPIAYTTIGTYKVELTVTDANGVSDSEIKTKYIKVVPAATIPPIADFMADRIFIAPGDYINFKDMSKGTPYIWKWRFPGASPSSSRIENPFSIRYPSAGKFDVELIIESNKGIDTILKKDYITVAATDPCVNIPQVDFIASQRLIRSGTKVFFEDKSKNNPTTWNWYFQGGYPNYLAVSNTIKGVEYNAAGFYDVSLSVNNACGSHSEYREDYILVFSGPVYKYCDTITNIAAFEGTYCPQLQGSWGYIGGHNGQKIKTYAEKFEQHSFSNIEALLYPVVVAQNAHYDSYITFFIWEGNTSYPENIIAQKKVLIRDIVSNFNNVLKFEQPVIVNGPFFVGYKINYVDNNSDGISDDMFAISIAHNRNYAGALNTLFVEANGTWSSCTDKFGVRTASAIKPVACITDIKKIELDNKINIYPNPANEYIVINIEDENARYNQKVDIKIIDITGKVVLMQNYALIDNEIQIDINQLPEGLYFVNMLYKDNYISRKIMHIK